MATCKECGASVEWVKSANRVNCINPDGTDHWDLCSKLRFERIKRTGEKVQYGKDIAYLTQFKKSGIQYVEQHSKIMRGANSARSGKCLDCVAPWEVCETCPDKLEAA